MKNVFLLGFAIVLFSSCVEKYKKNTATNFDVTITNVHQDEETPMEPAIDKATDAWEKTKFVCEIIWYQTP